MSHDTLKPQFFVTRQNGDMVPLVAMDELPANVKIRNVSRSLSPSDVSGMTSVGTFEVRHLQHVLEPSQPAHVTEVSGPVSRDYNDSALLASEYAATYNFSQPSCKTGYSTPPRAYGIEEQAPIHGAQPPCQPRIPLSSPVALRATLPSDTHAASSAPAALPPWHDISSLLPSGAALPGVKKYCSYWLSHGECDYAQQGCLFKHEMPLDKTVLQRLGLRDIPRWYREQHGLGSYLAKAGAEAGGDVNERTASNKRREIVGKDNWRKVEVVGGNTSKITTGTGVMPRSLTNTNITPSNHARAANGSPRNEKSILQAPATANMPSPMPRLKPVNTHQFKTKADRQMRKTLAQLNAYEEAEKKRREDLEALIRAGNEATVRSIVAENCSDRSFSSSPSTHVFDSDIADDAPETSSTSATSSNFENDKAAPAKCATINDASPEVTEVLDRTASMAVAESSRITKVTPKSRRSTDKAVLSNAIGLAKAMPSTTVIARPTTKRNHIARRQVQSRRRLAPASESGDSMSAAAAIFATKSMGKGKDKKAAKQGDKKAKVENANKELAIAVEKDLLEFEGYDHGD